MRETALDEMFADFEAQAAPTFRPPGVPAAQRRIRDRRRRRRGLLAGVVALLLAGPAGAYAAAGRDGDRTAPTPTPSPTVSPSPNGRPVERKVALADVAGKLTELRFVDARNGWALFDTCDLHDFDATDCRRTLGRTVDGGATWQRTALPAAANSATGSEQAYLLPVSDRTATVVVGRRYLVTTDGGVSFTEHDSPPRPTQLGVATRSGFLIRCPGGNGVLDLPCSRPQLARVGAAKLPTQPPMALSPDPDSGTDRQLLEGGDGRLWVAVRDGDRLTVAVSDDGAATWRKLPTVADAARLLVSPDGADVWLVSLSETEFNASDPNRVWELVGDRWQERAGLPDGSYTAAATNGRMLAVTSAYGNAGWWVDERYVDAPETRSPAQNGQDPLAVQVLPDDSLVLINSTGTILGTGSGTNRTWIRFS